MRRFVLENIDSVEQLRVLMLLHENPAKEWTINDFSTELRSTESSIEKRLNALYTKGILQRADNQKKHKYTPANEKIAGQIGELAQFYSQRPYRVIDLIYSKPNEALLGFADAFKIKRSKDDG